MSVFFVNLKGRAHMQMYRIVPQTKRANMSIVKIAM